jgi:hypothetical protein
MAASDGAAQGHGVQGSLRQPHCGRREEHDQDENRFATHDAHLKPATRRKRRTREVLIVGFIPIQGSAPRAQNVRSPRVRGEPEKALDQLEPLQKLPYYLSPGRLKIDPNFDPLRKNPRFQKLVAGG